MPGRKAIIFDRDGVINDVVLRDKIISSPRNLHEFKIRDEFKAIYAQIDTTKFALYVASNQPDVARGLLPESELKAMNNEMQKHFDFTAIFYCTHDNDALCQCRKPQPGMVLQALEQEKIEPTMAIMIGDSWKDIGAGLAAGVTTVYLKREYNGSVNKGDGSLSPDFENRRPNLVIDRLTELVPIFEAM